VLFASLPSGISLSLERFVANEVVGVETATQGFLRIINERFAAVEGNCNGYRILHTPLGETRFDGGVSPDPDSDRVVTFDHPAWVNVDGRVGIVFAGSGDTVYLNRHYFKPWWAVADDLTLSRLDKPVRARPGDVISQLAALVAPDRSPAQTRRLSLTVLSNQGSAAGLLADGHLALASFQQQPASIAFSCALSNLAEIPIFEGTTRIGKTRVTYRRHLEAGQALLQKRILTVTTDAEVEVIAADGKVCFHNPRVKQALVRAGGKGPLRIRPGGTAWLG
jgi:hypothetical protein